MRFSFGACKGQELVKLYKAAVKVSQGRDLPVDILQQPQVFDMTG